ncbi:MAG: peptidoglycan DD-metalloendopeptidase family protein [Candidatus Aminicenantes bacterium]|nr:peptidoglycan DD-metalloendopeptidase family protein [Candidatus Aminicenantes bacterium]
MSRRRRIAILLAAWALLPPASARIASPLSAQSQTPQASQDLSEYEKRLAAINEQILGLKNRLAEEGKKQETILGQLARISLTKSLLQKELALYEVRLDKNSRDLTSLRKKSAELQARLDSEKRSMERTLVALYKFGRFDIAQSLLQAENVQVLFSESKLLAGLARYQETTIAEYLKTLGELETTRAALESKRAEIAALLGQSRSKRAEIEREERKNKDFLTLIERNKTTFVQNLEELKASAEELQTLMKKLSGQAAALPFIPIPLSDMKGRLPWPIEGTVATGFGIQRHARFNTAVMNNGIEIVLRKDNLIVQAVHPGKIAFADFLQGYGNLLILDHGLTFYTLYAHCAEFLVKLGDVVGGGQPLALAGDYGSLKGPTLYFEIRFRTQALNPLLWLKKK